VEQRLEVDDGAYGSRLAGECAQPNGMEAGGGDEPLPAASREKPLDGDEPWTWLRDETSP
jgi:hypothetical protein